jgi:hypothetical protein
MARSVAKEDAETLALGALGWTLASPDRADRLLATTGLAPGDLRARIGERAVLAAALTFLTAHEADLVACAADLQVPPADLAAAAAELENA